MIRKSLLALAAVASLGALALTTTNASAFHGSGFRSGGVHFNAARVVGPNIAFRRNFAFRRIVRIWPPHHHWHWRWHHYRPYWVAPVAAVGPSYAVAPTYNRCTCLTKSYTQEGAVVFKDVCTNEIAMNPPADAAPQAPASQGPASQVPVQQGYLQPQPAQ